MEKGYGITTWRMTLRCGHPEWLVETEKLYRQVCLFYYNLILEEGIVDGKGGIQQMQREAERLTIRGRDKKEPVRPLPFEKVPSYFRRSAINKAIAAARSQKARQYAGRSEALEAPVTFFKGMYRELTGQSVELKVWDGEKWRWLHCRLKGKPFPEACQLMSPSAVCEYGRWMFHVPVRQETEDARDARSRMAAGERICSLQFTNTDAFVVCCVLDGAGTLLKVKFIGGGKEYQHHCRRLEEKVKRSWGAMGYGEKGPAKGERPEGQPNKKYFLHLKHLGEYYGHKASKEIVEFCREQGVKVLVMPEYEEGYSRMVQMKAGNYSPLHLGNRIREYVEYKSWAAGMVVVKVSAAGTSGMCSECGAQVKREGEKTSGELVVCVKGHRKNRFVNTGVNLGRKCLRGFGEKKPGMKGKTAVDEAAGNEMG